MKKAFAFIALLLAACLVLANGQSRRVVRPNDQVSVNCEEEQAISKTYSITKDGFIVMQYVGAVRIGGLSETAAAAKIGQALVSEKILPQATVTVQVVSSKRGVISFSGAVQINGDMPPQAGLRLSDVVKAAQPASNANLQRVRIVTAAGNEFEVNFAAYDGSNNVNNPEVRGGDNVFFDALANQPAPPVQPNQPPQPVPQGGGGYPQPLPTHPTGPGGGQNPIPVGQFVTVLGAVGSPRTVPYSPGLTVTGAIADAGGLLKNSDSGDVTVQRRIDGQTRTLKENVGDVNKGMAGDMALLPNDIIQVPYHHSHGPNKTLKIGALILLGLLILH